MQGSKQFIYENIIRDMQEGVLTINMEGKIQEINPAGYAILGLDESALGKSLVMFLLDERNDAFTQAILDSIYDKGTSHNTIVDYYNGQQVRKLFVNTSYLRKEEERVGIVAVLNDVTELMELKDAMVAMNRIKELNKKLELRNDFIKKTFGRYLSDKIVNQILDDENGTKIGGEKKVVTIVFSDLRAFTTISEAMNPQDLIRMLNGYLEQMIDCIMKWNGTILEFIGDAILAVFGGLTEDKLAADHAVQCAAEMQCRMKEINRHNHEQGFPALEMGIGVHTGDVIIGNIGSEQKAKYDIIGRNVNLASRIESYAVGGQVLVSEELKSAVQISLKFRGVKEVLPKGVAAPIRLYDLDSAGEVAVPMAEQDIEEVVPPVKLYVEVVEGKSVKEEPIEVSLTACGPKRAVITGNYPFLPYMNLKFPAKEAPVFAKVISKKDEDTLIHFTYGTLADKAEEHKE